MPPILIHYALKLDLEGRNDIDGVVRQFLEQAGLTNLNKSVEMLGSQCTIRVVIEGPETLHELREAVKNMPKGLFSEAARTAVKTLKELPSDLYLELSARLPLFGHDEETNDTFSYSSSQESNGTRP